MLAVTIDSIRYSAINNYLLSGIRFVLQDGDILRIQGATGSGKTTLLKIIAGVLPDFEPCEYIGEVLLDRNPLDIGTSKRNVSFCFQLPEYQFLFDTVQRQFHIRNGVSADYQRLNDLCQALGINHLLRESVKDISTGQRKLVAIASVLHKNRRIRLFDEPTSNLDPQAIEKVLSLIRQTADNCITIIASHDEKVDSISTYSLRMESANKQWVWDSVNTEHRHEDDKSFGMIRFSKNTISEREIIFDCEDITYRYPNGELGLKPVSFSICRGDCFSVWGNTGSGKTTLIRILAEEIKPTSGKVLINKLGKCGVVFQENERQLFSHTVLGELLLGLPRNRAIVAEARAILEEIGLANQSEIPPFFLSGGEKKKLLIASVLLHHPATLILDEPFAGMDAISVEKIVGLLNEYRKSNSMTLLIVEHRARLVPAFFSKHLEIKSFPS